MSLTPEPAGVAQGPFFPCGKARRAARRARDRPLVAGTIRSCCCVMSCGVQTCFQIRIEPELRDRLARLRDERHVNPGAWARDVIAAALDRELPADLEAPKRQPLAGWKPCKLGDGWGAVLDGPVSPRSRRTRAPRRSASRTAGAAAGRLRSPRSSPATGSASSSATPAGRRTSRYARHALGRPGVDRRGHRPRPGRSHRQRHGEARRAGRPTSRPPS